MSETATLDADATADLVAWAETTLADHDDRFEAAKKLTRRLGAQYRRPADSVADVDEPVTEVGFWVPELDGLGVADEDVYLEVLTATESVDLSTDDQSIEFDRKRVPLERHDQFAWGVVRGMRAGTRDRLGSLYRLAYRHDGEPAEGSRDGPGDWYYVEDPVAYSVPFGAYAPAELYDMDRLDEERDDREYFQNLVENGQATVREEDDGLPRVDPAVSMLELHPGTSAEDGTLAGVAETYERIAVKQERGEDLTPAERNFVGYDAMQVMPVEPLTEHEDQCYWSEPTGDPDADTVTVETGRPDQINWGYDIVVRAFSAPNPAILRSRRPHELVDFIATLHNLPRPIKVVFDIALGHSDNGGLELLNEHFFEGPGMYGQELDYLEPVARATFLELQRRKMDFGADGIRVDGAQDFTNWDPEAEESWHDDDYLAAMDDIVQEVAGVEYKPWMIYEDGRPWPREDWELASTYRALVEQHPHSFQWGPISFAHNTPALLTFWISKFWRVREVIEMGENWLTGSTNHDTIRRGTQIDTTVESNQTNVNPYLADTQQDTLDRAYDNPAAASFYYAFLPGVPMDFLHGNMRAPWGFIRDTDDTWNVKVVSEEAQFVDWQVREADYDGTDHFQRLKDHGLETREEFRRFAQALNKAVKATEYDADAVAAVVDAVRPPLFEDDLDGERLEEICLDWMRDAHEFAHLHHWTDRQDDDHTAFMRRVREFRHERPWLRYNLSEDDYFTHRQPANGTVLFYGAREGPDGEQILFVANMEGAPATITPADLPVPELPSDGWELALAPPALDDPAADDEVTLSDSQALVYTNESE